MIGASAAHRYFGPYHGKVVDNVDPEGGRRVRCIVPGLIEPASAWALPRTFGGGAPKRGGHRVPEIGADVIVEFLGGDPERPIYSGGHWGWATDDGNEVPTAANGVPDSEQITVFEGKRLSVMLDEREGKQKLVLEDKRTGDSIQWDFERAILMVSMTTAVYVKAKGAISIDALQTTIKGRLVTPSPKAL